MTGAIDTGEILEALNDKADIDLSNAVTNVSSAAKNTMIGWGIPNYASTSSNVGNNYTAPSDGIYWFSIANNNNTRTIIIKPAGSSQSISFTNVMNSYGSTGGYQVVLGKGDNIIITSADTTLSYSYFIPLKGVNS